MKIPNLRSCFAQKTTPFLILLGSIFFSLPLHAVVRTWNGSTGNWNDPAKWSGGTMPVATDDVIINGGTVTVDQSVSVVNFSFNGGVINGAGSVTATGNFSWTGGQVATNIVVAAAATATVTGNPYVTSINTGTITNNGSMTWNGGNFAGSGGASGAWVNNGIFHNVGNNGNHAMNSQNFNNFGVFNSTASIVTFNNGGLAVTFNNKPGGSVNIMTGTFYLWENGAQEGSFTLFTGTTLDLGNNFDLNFSGTVFLNNGNVTANNGSNQLKCTGPAAQTLSGTGTVKNLEINKTSNSVRLGSDHTVTSSLKLTAQNLMLDTFNLTLGPACVITGGSASSYVSTTGIGVCKRTVANNNTPVLFPVGNGSYTPASISLNAASSTDVFGLRVINGIGEELDGNGNSLCTEGVPDHVVIKTWFITENIAGGTNNAILNLQWDVANEGVGFSRTACTIARYDGADWLPGAFGAAAGSNPYTRQINGFTTFGAFGVLDNSVMMNRPAPVAGNDGPKCVGHPVQLSVTTIPQNTYYWTGPNGFTSTEQNPVLPDATLANAGIYIVSATQHGCASPAAATTVVINPAPALAVSGNLMICAGGATTLTATGGASYLWSTGQTTDTIVASSAGIYSVTATNANGCTAIQTVTLVVQPAPPAAIQGELEICPNASTVLVAYGGTEYLWSNATANDSVTIYASGLFTVTVTGANGCSATASAAVAVLPATAAISGDVAICTGQNTVLTASGGGTYLWHTGDTTAILAAVSSAGWYQVTTTASNGCTAVAGVQVTVSAWPQAGISGDTTLCTGSQGTLTAWGGTTFLWNTGDATPSIGVQADGIYTVTVANAAGCAASATRSVQFRNIVPGTPDGLSPDAVTALQDTDLFLEWNPVSSPDGAEARYDVYVWEATGNRPAQPSLQALRPNRVFFPIPNPILNHMYHWQVVAHNQFCPAVSDTAVFLLRDLPDLVVDTNILIPNTLIAGENITVSYMVRNLGPGYTGLNTKWFEKIYFSDDAVLQQNADILLGKVDNLSALYAGETYTRTVTFRIPIDVVFTGQFHIIVETGWMLDKQQQQEQKFPQINVANDTTASTRQVTVVLPSASDLRVVAANCPLLFLSNSQIWLDWVVQNTGDGKTNVNSWRDDVLLVSDTTDLSSGVSLATIYRDSALYRDSSYVRHVLSGKVPASYSGRYYVVITADASQNVWESVKETNNRKIIPVDILLAGAPDLAPGGLILPDTIYYGLYFPAALTLRNIGLAPVEMTNLFANVLRLDQEPAAPGAASITGNRLTRAWINAAESARDTIWTVINSAKLPPPGHYRPKATVDASNAIFEYQGEANNDSTYQQLTTLAPPDLALTAVTVNATQIKAGYPLDVTYTVKNLGHPFIPQGRQDRVYLTTSSNPAAPAVLQWSRADFGNQVMLHNANQNHVAQLNLLCNMPAGAYYLWVETGLGINSDIESDTANSRFQPLLIQVMPGDCSFDLAVTSLQMEQNLEYCTEYEVAYAIKNVGVNPVYYGKDCAAGDDSPFRDIIGVHLDSVFSVQHVLTEKVHCQGSWIFPGDSIRVSARIKISTNNPVGAGDWYLMVIANAVNMGGEADTPGHFNNFRGARIHLPVFVEPDLTYGLESIPAEIVAGQPFTVRLRIRNAGVAPVSAQKTWANEINFSPEDHNLSDKDDPGGHCGYSYFCETVTGLANCPCYALWSNYFKGPLLPGADTSQMVALTLPANTPTGYYYLVATGDIRNVVCETDDWYNNQTVSAIYVRRPDPADLVVRDIRHPDTVDVGKPFDISWRLVNQGTSQASGEMREAAYLSEDAQWSEDDILLGYRDAGLPEALMPNQERTRTLQTSVVKASLQDYYVIVRTDLRDNIWETDNHNNAAVSAGRLAIRIPRLPIGPDVEAVLYDDDPLYFRLETETGHLGETILVELTTPDSVEATNQLYLRRGILPSLDDFDYRSLRSGFGNQEAAIPAVENVSYFLMVDGRKGFGADSQRVKLRAAVLPFQIRSVDATRGGNTGFATVLLRGAKFDPIMQLFLRSDSTEIPLDSLDVTDPTRAFARFDLTGQPTGNYALHGLHPGGDTATWQYYTVEPGGPPEVVAFLRHPAEVESPTFGPGKGVRPLVITLDFENLGNTDVPLPYQTVRSLAGAPLALGSADLQTSQATEILVPLREQGGPQNYLRAGAKGSVLIWVNWAEKAMVFVVEEREE